MKKNFKSGALLIGFFCLTLISGCDDSGSLEGEETSHPDIKVRQKNPINKAPDLKFFFIINVYIENCV